MGRGLISKSSVGGWGRNPLFLQGSWPGQGRRAAKGEAGSGSPQSPGVGLRGPVCWSPHQTGRSQRAGARSSVMWQVHLLPLWPGRGGRVIHAQLWGLILAPLLRSSPPQPASHVSSPPQHHLVSRLTSPPASPGMAGWLESWVCCGAGRGERRRAQGCWCGGLAALPSSLNPHPPALLAHLPSLLTSSQLLRSLH